MRNDSLSLQKLAIVLMALVALATTSLALSYVELPPWIGLGSALLIAAAKIVLVALYFMELAEHRGGLRLAAITGPRVRPGARALRAARRVVATVRVRPRRSAREGTPAWERTPRSASLALAAIGQAATSDRARPRCDPPARPTRQDERGAEPRPGGARVEGAAAVPRRPDDRRRCAREHGGRHPGDRHPALTAPPAALARVGPRGQRGRLRARAHGEDHLPRAGLAPVGGPGQPLRGVAAQGGRGSLRGALGLLHARRLPDALGGARFALPLPVPRGRVLPRRLRRGRPTAAAPPLLPVRVERGQVEILPQPLAATTTV
ncbi:MAG: cytochrome C oxidase subunit IV family protein [Sandaracinaceae bacterium]|nr:cytochrome C oxidase subunit IV family protein [Sandaracinaceae bacterium]